MSRKHRRWAFLKRKAQTTVTLNITGLMAAVIIAILGVIVLVVSVVYGNTSAFDFGISLTSIGAGGALGVTIPTITQSA